MEVVLPEEMIIEIGSHLPIEDILNCNQVNRLWRNSLNSNRIWSELCSENFGVDTTSTPLIEAPCEVDPPFSPPPNSCEKLSSPCSWWIRYMQETWIANNFRHDRFKEVILDSTFKVLKIFDDSLVGLNREGTFQIEFWSLFPLRKIDFINTESEFSHFYETEREFMFIFNDNLAYYYKKENLKYELKYTINLFEHLFPISNGPIELTGDHFENGYFAFFSILFDLENVMCKYITIWNLKDLIKKTAPFLPDARITNMKMTKSKFFFLAHYAENYILYFVDLDNMEIKGMPTPLSLLDSNTIPHFLNDEIVFAKRLNKELLFFNIYHGKTYSVPLGKSFYGIKPIDTKYLVVFYHESLKIMNCNSKTFIKEIAFGTGISSMFLYNSMLKIAYGYVLFRDASLIYICNLKTMTFSLKDNMQYSIYSGSSSTLLCRRRRTKYNFDNYYCLLKLW